MVAEIEVLSGNDLPTGPTLMDVDLTTPACRMSSLLVLRAFHESGISRMRADHSVCLRARRFATF